MRSVATVFQMVRLDQTKRCHLHEDPANPKLMLTLRPQDQISIGLESRDGLIGGYAFFN